MATIVDAHPGTVLSVTKYSIIAFIPQINQKNAIMNPRKVAKRRGMTLNEVIPPRANRNIFLNEYFDSPV